jgi:hypothetical protein
MNDIEIALEIKHYEMVTRLHKCEKMLKRIASYYAEQNEVTGDPCPICECVGHSVDCELVKLVRGEE